MSENLPDELTEKEERERGVEFDRKWDEAIERFENWSQGNTAFREFFDKFSAEQKDAMRERWVRRKRKTKRKTDTASD
ncbi:MAG: hypothetical protein ACJ72Z_13490 [Pyrinomonadaceae bacterium]